MWWQALIVFVAVFTLDLFFAVYTKAVAEAREHKSAIAAIAIYAVAAVGTVSVVANNWMVIPACMGAGLGTWVSVRFRL